MCVRNVNILFPPVCERYPRTRCQGLCTCIGSEMENASPALHETVHPHFAADILEVLRTGISRILRTIVPPAVCTAIQQLVNVNFTNVCVEMFVWLSLV